MGGNIFAVPVFFIIFRETLETSIVVGILLGFLKQTLSSSPVIHKRQILQVWVGTFLGLFVCLIIGAGIIGAFYSLRKRNLWSSSEDLYEGIFSLVASVIITIMGAIILRINKIQETWRTKLANIEHETSVVGFSKRYAMFLLPFVTVLREGVEAVIFVGGIGLAEPASAFPLPVVCALLAGCTVGYVVYRGGVTVGVKWFLIASTALLYLVAAGLLSKAAWSFDMYRFTKLVGGDVAEAGVGPGSYNIHRSVWHVNCCSPKFNGGAGWGIFYALLGWQNSATYSSVITYNVYWIVVASWFIVMAFKEKNGKYPFMQAKPVASSIACTSDSDPSNGKGPDEKAMEEAEVR